MNTLQGLIIIYIFIKSLAFALLVPSFKLFILKLSKYFYWQCKAGYCGPGAENTHFAGGIQCCFFSCDSRGSEGKKEERGGGVINMCLILSLS